MQKKHKLDEVLFSMEFSRDSDYHDTAPINTYLSKITGEVLWVYEDDESAEMAGMDPEQNRHNRNQVDSASENYLVIPGLSHEQHHEILKAFLDSDWTANQNQHSSAQTAYIGSIGAWLKRVDDDTAVEAYFNFREKSIDRMKREFLHDNGIGHFESDL